MTPTSSATHRTRTAVVRLVAIGAGSLLVLTGCTPPASDPAPKPKKDLELSIGTLLPQTGALAQFGPTAEAGVALAVADVNDAGVGITVTSQIRDSGDNTTDTAVTSVDDLISLDVSMIVGAISGNVSKKVIDKIVGAGIVEISPGNVSPDFTRYDDDNLYWRTAPSCTLEGDVLGKKLADDGAKTLGIIYQRNFCEPGLPEALAAGFADGGGSEVVAQVPFEGSEAALDAQVAEVVAAKPDAVVIVTDSRAGLIVPGLAAAGYDGSKLGFIGLTIADHSADLPAGSITGAQVTLPGLDITKLKKFTDRVLEVTPGLTDFSYTAESYDAVILAALAALAAGDTSGKAIASKLQEVSGGSGEGEKATDFAAAARIILDGGAVDYDGPSGPVTFDENGDPTGAVIGVYKYGADNVFTRVN